VREKGVLSLAEAARKLTSDPAKVFGIPGRGRLEVGHSADLFLFDPAKIGRGPKKRVQDLPAGGTRLVMAPLGVHGVWVNGVLVADEKGPRPLARLPGKVLREFNG
jgi:N-acyl-D-aspartate/D-glutamate deacylase